MARASAVKMPPEANAAHGCEGARRVLALMLTFSADDHTLTARQLAERTGIALPSVYRYLTLLRETGLLAGDERGSYRLSARLVGLARRRRPPRASSTWPTRSCATWPCGPARPSSWSG